MTPSLNVDIHHQWALGNWNKLRIIALDMRTRTKAPRKRREAEKITQPVFMAEQRVFLGWQAEFEGRSANYSVSQSRTQRYVHGCGSARAADPRSVGVKCIGVGLDSIVS